MSPGIHPGINHTHAQTPSSFFLPFSTANGHFSRPTSLSDSHKVAAKAYVFLLGKKYSVLKGRKRRLLLLSGFFFLRKRSNRDSGRDGTKEECLFFGSNSSGFFVGYSPPFLFLLGPRKKRMSYANISYWNMPQKPDRSNKICIFCFPSVCFHFREWGTKLFLKNPKVFF